MSVNSFNNGVAVRKSIARGAAATGDRSVKIVRGLTDFMRGVFAREPAAPTAKEIAADLGPEYEREVIHRDHLALHPR